MQVFGLPSQFASAMKIAKHWPKKDSCKLAACRTSALKRLHAARRKGLAAADATNAIGFRASSMNQSDGVSLTAAISRSELAVQL